MALVADQDHMPAEPPVTQRLLVDLGNQRAGRVEIEEIARRGVGRHGFRHAMRGKDHRLAAMLRRYLVQFLDEDRALGFEPLDHIAIVNDLVPDIDRRAIGLEGQDDDLDRAIDAGTEAARRAKTDSERGTVHVSLS